MTIATTNSMKILLAERNDSCVSIKVPARMKKLISAAASKKNMNESMYIKSAILEQLSNDM